MDKEMERQQFTFYRSYYEARNMLPDKARLAYDDAVMAYALDGIEPDLKGAAATAFILTKPTLDTGRRKAKSGKRGGETSKATDKQTESKQEAKAKQSAREKEVEREKEGEGEGEIEIEIENECSPPISPSRGRQSRFIPPTVDEVRAYCAARGNSIDPEAFVSFYASKGWMIGKNKMKDWKQAVITWETKRKGENRGTVGSNSGENPETSWNLSATEL